VRAVTIAAIMMTLSAGGQQAADAAPSQYRGWKSLALSNGLVTVQVVPQVGGRVIQLTLAGLDFLWNNNALAGRAPN